MDMQNKRIKWFLERRWAHALVCLGLLLVLGMDVSAGSITAGNQVDVDISWGEMAFTYTEEYQLWNPDTHEYDKDVSAGWTAEENWLTVQNNDTERAIKATLSSTSNVSSVQGLFRADGAEEAGTAEYTMELDVGTSRKLWFELTGTITTTYENLGEIIITIIAK